MMSSEDFTGMMKSTAALVEAVVQTNLRAAQELLRAEIQRLCWNRSGGLVREYTAVLMQGTMTLVGAIEFGSIRLSSFAPVRRAGSDDANIPEYMPFRARRGSSDHVSCRSMTWAPG